jgi:hypothetical protein
MGLYPDRTVEIISLFDPSGDQVYDCLLAERSRVIQGMSGFISWILENFGCEITVEEATCFTNANQEMELPSKELPDNLLYAPEPGLYSIMAIKR